MALPTADLLAPIPGDAPAGADLRYAPTYTQLTEARREEDDAPQGEWKRTRKVAEYDVVVKVATDALATKSKDLMIAAWLTEALTRREGFAGLAYGLDLVRGLIDKYWDGVFPLIDEGDLGLRVRPLNWIGSGLEPSVKAVPLNRAGHDFITYTLSRQLGYESAVSSDNTKKAARQKEIDGGKVPPEEFDKSFEGTPKAWYKQLVAALGKSQASLAALDAQGNEKFGDDAPSFGKLQSALEAVHHLASQLLEKKLLADPDPPEVVAAEAAAAAVASGAPAPAEGAPRVMSAEPTDINDATMRVVSAARWLRKNSPSNPASYLLLRGLRWGEVRASGRTPNPKLLEAPNGDMRVKLKTLMIDGAWDQLLDAAEQVMGTPAGRGWLDLQRYTLTACAGLGSTYDAPAGAIRGALRSLLADIPDLPSMSLMDDLPAANADTRSWLQELGPMATSENGAAADAPSTAPAVPASYIDERVRVEIQAGRPAKAIDILMREIDRETSRRARWMRQAQIARVMVDAGLETVAKPILEQLMAEIESHKLEEWEAGELVAQPLVLLWRCLDKLGGDANAKQTLYLRICKLDARQAIAFAKP
ncbi:MAG TPA: type VI secretion system protein TssA [Gemmatimonadaceae bacterium]|nr:type VI secretion system protein TssA [Gemmatimonadaceae bacterium]